MSTGAAIAMELIRLLNYLSPGLPLALFGLVASHPRRSRVATAAKG
jgi:hypothetical protein